ncbi:MAG TPA: Fic family protein [Spirochaetes bacterium]|nr:Fic family protein [Spirochaetota bacterium]
MKLPEKPINWKEIFEKELKQIVVTIEEKDLLKQIVEFNIRYLYWSELKYRVKDESDKKYIWTFMKWLRLDKYETLMFDSIKMKYSIITDFSRRLHRFDKFLAGNIEIQSKTLGLQKKYMISSLMEEAIASSIIEGASTTRKTAKSMLREKRKPRTKSEKMIVNNYETMHYIISIKNKKLTPEILLEIQKKVTKDTLEGPDYEGAFRDNNEIVVGYNNIHEIIAHIPPDYKEVPNLIEELCKFGNDDSGKFIHPIIKGIVLHFLIGYIHPFNDGNGRTARSIFYWYILSQGYWLFEYMSLSRKIVRSRKEYDLAYLYSEYDEMDLTYFIKYNIKCIDESLDDLMDYIKKKQTEQEETKKIIHENSDLNLRQAMILEEFIKNPNKIFTIKEISETYQVVYQTARTDLLLLAGKGFIDKKTSGKAFIFSLNEKSPLFFFY